MLSHRFEWHLKRRRWRLEGNRRRLEVGVVFDERRKSKTIAH